MKLNNAQKAKQRNAIGKSNILITPKLPFYH